MSDAQFINDLLSTLFTGVIIILPVLLSLHK